MDVQSVIDNFKTIVTRHYMDFEGRARRQDFWLYFLAVLILSLGLAMLSAFGGMGGILPNLLALALLLPNLGLAVRRLHDTGRSDWFVLLGFIPVLGWLALLYFYVQPGDSGANRYGPDPKGAA